MKTDVMTKSSSKQDDGKQYASTQPLTQRAKSTSNPDGEVFYFLNLIASLELGNGYMSVSCRTEIFGQVNLGLVSCETLVQSHMNLWLRHVTLHWVSWNLVLVSLTLGLGIANPVSESGEPFVWVGWILGQGCVNLEAGMGELWVSVG